MIFEATNKKRIISCQEFYMIEHLLGNIRDPKWREREREREREGETEWEEKYNKRYVSTGILHHKQHRVIWWGKTYAIICT